MRDERDEVLEETRLNPCFNGRWSASRLGELEMSIWGHSLNPCFNGRWSARAKAKGFIKKSYILS